MSLENFINKQKNASNAEGNRLSTTGSNGGKLSAGAALNKKIDELTNKKTEAAKSSIPNSTSTILASRQTNGAIRRLSNATKVATVPTEEAIKNLASSIEKQVEAEMIANSAHISFVIDRSSSMYGSEDEVVSNTNNFISEQAELAYDTKISVTLFNDSPRVKIDGVPAKNRPMLDTYRPDGTTSLYDAICYAAKQADKHARQKHNIHVIVTDGEDCTSSLTIDEARSLITAQRRRGDYYLLLSNGPNAAELAKSLGIDPEMAADFDKEGDGFKIIFDTINKIIGDLRKKGTIDHDWADAIKKHKQNPALTVRDVARLATASTMKLLM
ncbi:MAG: VWA domain-containing protein [Clostridiales bacterium]|jgi:hypothetical protein|nr:VWA domain-containing protein [Clostridiales bacterium]